MLPLDCILNYIKYFDIYMLTNYALIYKYGFECIQKHIHNKKIMNDNVVSLEEYKEAMNLE